MGGCDRCRCRAAPRSLTGMSDPAAEAPGEETEVEKPDPYTCPDDFPEAIKQLLTVLKRGQNCATADPQDGDLESLLSHIADDVELIVPKTFIEKSIKDGGDPINRAGKEEVAKILKSVLWSELATVTDVNDDGKLDANDFPIWTPLAEIKAGEPAIAGRTDCPNPVRPGRVFRRRCALVRRLMEERFKQTIVVDNDKITAITTAELSAQV